MPQKRLQRKALAAWENEGGQIDAVSRDRESKTRVLPAETRGTTCPSIRGVARVQSQEKEATK